MIIETRLIETYLNKKKFNFGLVVSLFFLTLCLIASLFYWDQSYSLRDYLTASPDLIFNKGEYWRLFTTLFTHGDVEHLLSNSLMLFFLMYFVTSFYGYIVSIGLSIVMGAFINLAVLHSYNSDITLVGISGVIYFLWGFWFALYILIDETISVTRRIVKVLGIFFILLVPTSYSPSTSYLAHYFGFFTGLLTAFIYYPLIRKKVKDSRRWKYKIVEDYEDYIQEE